MDFVFTKLKQFTHVFNKRITLLMVALALIIPSVIIGAESNISKSNNTMVRPKASDVPNMTIIIGTHMIAINSLTTELNDIAEKSAEDSAQNKIYYKSELVDEERSEQDNKGVWYEIQSAQNVDDILPSSKYMVEDELIDKLALTHFTDKDGKTWDLLTGNEVDIFNIEDVYDVSSIEELKALKLEYDAKKDSKSKDEQDEGKAKSLEEVKESLKSVLEMNVKNEEMEKLDLIIDALKKYYDYVVLREATDEERDKVSSIRSDINNKRKVAIFDKIIEKIDEEIQNVSELEDSYGAAKNELMNSKTTLESQITVLNVDENAGLMERKIAELAEQLIVNAQKNDYSEADENLRDILSLENITLSIISDSERQLSLIKKLKEQVDSEYNQLINSGESDEYKQAKMLNKSLAVLDSIKNEYMSKLKRLEADVNSIEDMNLKLLGSKEDQAKELQLVVDKLSQQIGNLAAEINSTKQQQDDLLKVSNVDVFKDAALNNLKLRLTNEISKLQAVNNDLNGSDEILEQENEMESLKSKYKKALDRNDLLGAKEIKEKIDVLQQKMDSENTKVDDRIQELNNQLSEIQKKLDESGLSTTQRANLEKQKVDIQSQKSQLGVLKTGQSSTDEKIISDAKTQAKKILSKNTIKQEDVEELEDNFSKIKNIAQTQPQIGYPAMLSFSEDIQSRLSQDSSVPSELLDVVDSVEQAVEDLKNEYNVKTSNELDENSIDEKADVFAADNSLTDVYRNLLLLGALNELLSDYGSVDDNTSIKDFNQNQKIIKLKMNKLMSTLISGDNLNEIDTKAALIDKKTKNAELYAKAEVVANLTGMRYIWEPNLVKGYLVGKGKNFAFTHGKNSITSSNNKMCMSNVAVFEPDKHSLEGNMWLPQSFLISEFEITVQGIKASNKAIVYSAPAYGNMKDMLKAIK